VIEIIKGSAGFLLDQGYPLFFSEFGFDLRDDGIVLDHFINCFLLLAAELDFDWNIWTLGRSYYLKEGVTGFE
jgi:hypothetical protein